MSTTIDARVAYTGLAALAVLATAGVLGSEVENRAARRHGDVLARALADAIRRAPAMYLMTRTDGYFESIAAELDPMLSNATPRPTCLLRGLVAAVPLCILLATSVPGAIAILAISTVVVGDGYRRQRVAARCATVYSAIRRALHTALGRPADLQATNAFGTAVGRWLDLRSRAGILLNNMGMQRRPSTSGKGAITLIAITSVPMLDHFRHGLPLESALAIQFGVMIASVWAYDGYIEYQRTRPWAAAITKLTDVITESAICSLPSELTDGGCQAQRLADASTKSPVLQCRALVTRPVSQAYAAAPTMDLSVDEGEAVAIIVNSGTGKTEFARILLGLHHSRHNRVMIDGRDVAGLREYQRRSLINGLLEDAEPMDGTIASNLSLNHQGADAEAIMRACHLVGIDTWINSLSSQMTTNVGKSSGISRRHRSYYAWRISLFVRRGY